MLGEMMDSAERLLRKIDWAFGSLVDWLTADTKGVGDWPWKTIMGIIAIMVMMAAIVVFIRYSV